MAFCLVLIRKKFNDLLMSVKTDTVRDKPTETIEELIKKVRKVKKTNIHLAF